MLTRPDDPKTFADLGGPDLVYVREVSASEILADAPEGAAESFGLAEGQTLFALHRADGERLAVLADRDSAFATAWAHELAPRERPLS